MKSKIVKMPKVIKFEVDGKTYKLEYNRDSLSQMEDNGFDIELINKKKMTMIPILIHGAFLMHNPNISMDEAISIYSNLSDKENIMPKLVEMCSDAITSLFGMSDAEESKNVKWEASW